MKIRRDTFTESSTYIVFMDGLPEYSKLYFKIGKSINCEERLRQLKTSNPFIKTTLLHHFDCEYFLQNELKEYKIKNEWFCIDEATKVSDVAIMIRPFITKFLEHKNELQ